MKKKLLWIMLLIVILTSTSCSNGDTNMKIHRNSDEEIADETFSEIISAIRLKDGKKIEDMFSATIKGEDTLSQSALEFVNYIQGDIISFSSALESGLVTDYKIENGKNSKEIQSSFCIITTQKTYYIAIKECIKDDFDDNNIGIMSIYIIESNNWTKDYVYRGDEKWTHGINIVESS